MSRRSRDDGISEVVGFVVILAVLMAGMSLYLTYAVPVQGREEEIKVMEDVRAWFVDYKTSVDQLWLNSPMIPDPGDPLLFNATIQQVTLRRVIDTGTTRERGLIGRFMPVLAPIPASAEVSVRNTETLTIRANRSDAVIQIWTNTAPTLSYTSHNYYWLQQEYYYQLGGVFLRQWDAKGGLDTENVTVIAAPPISIYNHGPEEGGTGYQTKVSIIVVNQNMLASGIGATSPIRVETRLDGDPIRLDSGSGSAGYSEVSLQFDAASSQTAEAWRAMFDGAASRNRLGTPYESHRDGTTAWINISGTGVSPPTNDVILEMLVANCTTRMGNVPTMIE